MTPTVFCLAKVLLVLLITVQVMHGATIRTAAAQTVTEDNVDASAQEDKLRLRIDQATGSDRRARAEAVRELTKLGPEMPREALRALIRAINAGSFLRGMEAAEGFRSLGPDIVPRLLDSLDDAEDEETRGCAVRALGAIGPPAAAAVDRLITILTDKTQDRVPPQNEPKSDDAVGGIREEAAAALGLVAVDRPVVTDTLLAVLADKQDQTAVRAKCALSLGRLRPTQDKVVDALIRAVRSETDVVVRARALQALAAIGPAAEAAIEPLITILEDKSLDRIDFAWQDFGLFFFAFGLREGAAEALSHIARDKPLATESLLAVLSDQQDRALVRGHCAQSLGRLHPPAEKVVPALILAVQSRDEYLRRCAARALTEYSPESDSAVDALLAALESPDAELRRAALDGIAKSCPQVKRAVAPLVKAVSDSDREVREKAVRALSAFGPRIAVTPLVEAFQRGCEEAEKGLRRIGEPAVPALVELLRDPDPTMRARAAKSLSSYHYEAAEALPVLREVCRDSSPGARRMAVRALGFIGVASPEVMQSLCQALGEQNAGVREEAASSLYCLVQQATPPTSLVLSALKETDPGLLHWLIATVQVGEMADERIMPLLRRHLDHPNRDVRESAVRALRIFGATASAAVPRIMELAANGSDWEKRSALQTLAEIGTSRDQAERLLAQHFHGRKLQESDSSESRMLEAMLHVLVPHPDLAERFLSQHPEIISNLRVPTAKLLHQQRGARFSALKRAVFDHPDLPAEVILEFRDPRYIPTLKRQMEKVHPHRRSYLAAVARALGDPPDRIVKISESEPGDFRPEARGRIGSFLEGHADGFSKVLVTGRTILEDGTPAPPPQFFEGNDRMLMGKQRREPRPVDYDPETGRFVFRTTVFAAYALGSQGKLGPYMTGPAVVIIEAPGCKPLSVVFYDEMPDVEITLTARQE